MTKKEEQILKEVTEMKTKRFEIMNYNKSEIVKMANFLRQHNLECEIIEMPFGHLGNLYKLIITKK